MQKWPPPKPSERTKPARHPLFSPTPDEIRSLVLDYLCHNSYTETARAFVRDSAVKHLDADGDELMTVSAADTDGGVGEGAGGVDRLAETLDGRLGPAEIRREIRIHILSGRVDDATALLNRHFPSVLSEEREPLLGSSENDNETSPPLPGSFDYMPSTSVDPTHLALNLRIHAFIEAARTVPLPYHSPSSSSFSSSSGSSKPTPTPFSPHSPTSPSSQSRSRSNSASPSPSPDEHQHELLRRAQGLYAEAQSLVRPEDRATYLGELGQVSGLLAYTDPENSPMAPYLTQERREAVAGQVESAILYRTNKSSISKMELYTRYTTGLWATLNEWEIKVPPASRWPSGVKLPADVNAPIATTTGRKGAGAGTYGRDPDVRSKKEKHAAETARVPKFDLTEFLNAKP
ncbi:hypothetical protein EIP91_003826 [Steccherinum ochraceum]|uniref:CRA domain-containing protein n=1 Tax=Steccherinum ochraceum TaxID=92696 RepID=A0A4R0RG83_9APHY|nr:hypothetical protein EIP91_003826 [Steccherinum ochraceum]